MARPSFHVLVVGALALAPLGCGGNGQGAQTSGSGGNAPSSGGVRATGGTTGGGGATATSTTTTTTVNGGATGNGGMAITGGSVSAAGASGRGGAAATGGATGSGGANGGASGNGGTTAAGGATGAGGTRASGGATSPDGGPGSGGVSVAGGATSSGGAIAAGGATSSGGATAAGGASARGGATSTGGATAGGGAAGAATGGTTGSTGAGGASCLNPPAEDAVVGWAAVDGNGVSTTTGGGNQTPKVVTTLADFKTAVSGTSPAVVYLNAVLAPSSIAVGSNKTIVGVCGAEIHGHLGLSGSSNVIVRNLKIVGYAVGDCTLDPSFDATVGCSSGADAVSITSAAHHIWFDHCDISDGTDGNLDTNAGSDFVTISWTKFHYTPRTDNVGNDSTGAGGHRFSNLVGSSDTVPEDVGHLNMTWHHNWWADNVNQRMPRTRRGKIHVVNNLYTSVGDSYCTNSGFETHLLVENNVYIGVKNPLSPDANGDMLARNNVFTNTSGTTTASGTGFSPPYALTPDATGNLEATIRAQAGPH